MRLCVHVQFVKLSVSSVAGQTGGGAKRFLFHVGTSPMYNFLSAASSVANLLCCNKTQFCVAVFPCISFPSRVAAAVFSEKSQDATERFAETLTGRRNQAAYILTFK